jgi:FAD/FMN-containing dehydrogenase
VLCPTNIDVRRLLRQSETDLIDIAYDTVQALSKSISGDHGVSINNGDSSPKHKSSVAPALRRSINQSLAPKITLNPGRVIRV